MNKTREEATQVTKLAYRSLLFARLVYFFPTYLLHYISQLIVTTIQKQLRDNQRERGGGGININTKSREKTCTHTFFLPLGQIIKPTTLLRVEVSVCFQTYFRTQRINSEEFQEDGGSKVSLYFSLQILTIPLLKQTTNLSVVFYPHPQKDRDKVSGS
eukprot:TRINITY_DN1502_c0_g2_i1.p6 TRINITY_DN1502_c0_g2~~TRINITY_DN1502_c0_g2_i1.p6  ORF type:complete len:158 (-),score=8.19 TRINITY_DN1502_c0_g2_i1:948-1421(-)